MRWRSSVTALLVLLTACTSNPAPPERAVTEGSTAPSSTPASDQPQPVSQPVDVLWTLDPSIGARIDELANYGYGGTDSTSTEQYGVPDLRARFPSLSVREVELGWGIDSSGLVVTADGPADSIAEAATWLDESTQWIVTGDGWLAALYQGGLAADFEMTDLSDTIDTLMAPATSLPPPPQLLVNAATADRSVPFATVEIENVTSIRSTWFSTSWLEDGTAVIASGDPTNPEDTREWADVSAMTLIGCDVFVATSRVPATIELRSCNEQRSRSPWLVPEDWHVDGLAFTGSFRADEQGLVVTAMTDDGRTAVRIPLGESFSESSGSDRFAVDLTSLAPLTSEDQHWSLPQRASDGDLLVVEERDDGWYLVDDALTAHEDVLRASQPILSYTADAGHRHLVIVLDGPDGPTTWWIHDEQLTQLDAGATSVAWAGDQTLE